MEAPTPAADTPHIAHTRTSPVGCTAPEPGPAQTLGSAPAGAGSRVARRRIQATMECPAPTRPLPTLPPRSTVSWTFFRKSRSRQRLESRMVVAYVDSVMSKLGRHLSIQAALQQRWPQPGGESDKLGPAPSGPSEHCPPPLCRTECKGLGRKGGRLCTAQNTWGTLAHATWAPSDHQLFWGGT